MNTSRKVDRYSELARRIDDAKQRLDAVLLDALAELESLDPILTQATLMVFPDRRRAARWLGYGLNGTDLTNVYAALAVGKRDTVRATLRCVRHEDGR